VAVLAEAHDKETLWLACAAAPVPVKVCEAVLLALLVKEMLPEALPADCGANVTE
jgi:hypothetical protein